MATTLGGVVLKDHYVQETSRRVIGGGIVRAVDGTAHRNSVRIVRTWRLQVRNVPYTDFLALEQAYNSANGGALAFHLDEWDGGVFVDVYVLDFPDERLIYPVGGNSSGRSFSLTLEEA